MKPLLVFHFSLLSVCACLCMPSPPPCPVSGQRSQPSCSPQSAGSSHSRGDSGKGSLDSWAGPALPSSVVVTAMCWLCQKRDETGLWEKLPVILCSGDEGGQLCLPAGSQHGSASCSPVEPAFMFFNNSQRGFVAVLLFVIRTAVLIQ